MARGAAFDVKIENLPELEKALRDVTSNVRAGAVHVVSEEVGNIGRDARATAPVKSGALRRGIHDSADGLEGTVKATARHSTFVEHGTYKDKAQPFMQPSAERARRRLPQRAAEILKKFVEGR